MRLSNHYLGPLTVDIRRRDLEEGQFGAIAPYYCERCGLIWRRPEYSMTHRQTWETPEEGEDFCQICGSPDTGENDAAPEPFKVVKRYHISRQLAA